MQNILSTIKGIQSCNAARPCKVFLQFGRVGKVGSAGSAISRTIIQCAGWWFWWTNRHLASMAEEVSCLLILALICMLALQRRWPCCPRGCLQYGLQIPFLSLSSICHLLESPALSRTLLLGQWFFLSAVSLFLLLTFRSQNLRVYMSLLDQGTKQARFSMEIPYPIPNTQSAMSTALDSSAVQPFSRSAHQLGMRPVQPVSGRARSQFVRLQAVLRVRPLLAWASGAKTTRVEWSIFRQFAP